MEKENPGKILRKTKEKERAKNQAVTVKESRSERVGLYRNEQGVCLPGTSEDSIALHRCHRSHRRKHHLLRGGNYRQTRKNTINVMQQYDA